MRELESEDEADINKVIETDLEKESLDFIGL